MRHARDAAIARKGHLGEWGHKRDTQRMKKDRVYMKNTKGKYAYEVEV